MKSLRDARSQWRAADNKTNHWNPNRERIKRGQSAAYWYASEPNNTMRRSAARLMGRVR